ncbi:DUF551 domain-containing protein [Citrobacter freundii]
MTTNNHPAHGPVSLDRLHQISEILSKASAQSDGGNLGYAIADAVKVIDGAIAAFGAEPVIVVGDDGADALSYRRLIQSFAPGTKLYAAPQLPQPAVVEIGEIRVGRLPTMNQDDYPGLGEWWVQLRIGEDSDEVLARVYGATPREANNRAEALACRTAMLQAGNSPVIPDGWIPVSERMPDKYDFDIWVFSPSKGIHDGIQWDGCEFADDEYQFKINDVSHWMKKIYPAAPQQEVKP